MSRTNDAEKPLAEKERAAFIKAVSSANNEHETSVLPEVRPIWCTLRKPAKNLTLAPSSGTSPNWGTFDSAKNHKRQKPQAPTPQAPVRNRQTRKVANAKVRIG